MTLILAILAVCLISGFLAYPWLTRSLNRSRHANYVIPPYDPGVNLAAGGDTSMPPYSVHIHAGSGHDHAAVPSHSGDGGGHSGDTDGGSSGDGNKVGPA